MFYICLSTENMNKSENDYEQIVMHDKFHHLVEYSHCFSIFFSKLYPLKPKKLNR